MQDLSLLAGVDEFVSATLVYSGNRMAVISSSLCTPAENMAVISGDIPCAGDPSKGVIKVTSQLLVLQSPPRWVVFRFLF